MSSGEAGSLLLLNGIRPTEAMAEGHPGKKPKYGFCAGDALLPPLLTVGLRPLQKKGLLAMSRPSQCRYQYGN